MGRATEERKRRGRRKKEKERETGDSQGQHMDLYPN